MPASKVEARIRLKVDRAREIAEARLGRVLVNHEVADYFGLTQSNFSRIATGQTGAGDRAIATVLLSHPDDPDITFDSLFEAVAA